MHPRTTRTVTVLTSILLAMTVIRGEAATLEISDYNLFVNRPGITTLDFESGSTNISTPPDISFAASSNAVAEWYGDGFLDFFASSGIPADEFGNQYLSNVSDVLGQAELVATFPDTVNFVGAWLHYMAPLQVIIFYLYDENDQPLFTQFLQAPEEFDQLYYYGVYSDQPIGRVVWFPGYQGNWDHALRLDNVTYGTTVAPVPAPAALWMLGTGVSCLVWRRYLKR